MALYHSARGSVGYTIVGSPTIVDGVASGFSNNNYIQTSTGNITSSSGQLGFIFTTSTNGNSSFCSLFTGTTAGIDYSRRIEFVTEGTSPRFRIYWDGLGSVWQAYNFPVAKNTKYKCVFSWTPTTISLSLQNLSNGGEVKTESKQLTTEQTSISFVQPQFLRSNVAYDTKLDLNGTYIITDGQPWFGICPIEVKKHQLMGPVGYTVVGSPTITDGVASGFSGSNYLQSSSTFPGSTSTSLEFATKFNISSFASTSTIVSSTTNTIPFHLAVRDSKFRLYPGIESTYKVGDFVLLANTDYWIKLFWDSTNGWKLQYSTDGTNYTTDFENYNPSNSAPKDNYIVLGRNYPNGGQEGLLGTIDLNHTYIKVNGKLWFWQPRETEKIVVNGVQVWQKSS